MSNVIGEMAKKVKEYFKININDLKDLKFSLELKGDKK